MALDLHKVMKDGTIEHEDLTRESWQRCLHDVAIATMWGHNPDDCHDVVARFFARLRRRGDNPTLSPEAHALADRDDPTWEGDRTGDLPDDEDIAGREAVVTRVVEPIGWPPPTELQPWLLAQLAGLCLDDAKDILAPPRKQLPEAPREKLANKHGQWSLFD